MPITTGRMPRMAPSTSRFPLSFIKKRATRIISVSDGMQTAKVAIAEPRMPHQVCPVWTPTL